MRSSLLRRLGLILLAAVVVFGAAFVLPAITPKGSSKAYPAWRSIEGVPVVASLPDGFVGVLRIARERNSEQARVSIVLGPDAPCATTTVRVGSARPLVAPLEGGTADCGGALRAIAVKAEPGPITVATGDTTWQLDPSARDPRSCQLSRDRTCAYWLFEGGRFGDPVDVDAERVQSNQPIAAAAVSSRVLGLTSETGSAAFGYDATGRATAMLCAAAASPRCQGERPGQRRFTYGD